MFKKIIEENPLHLFFAIFMSCFFGLMTLQYDFKVIIILGFVVFIFVFLAKMEYAFYFLLASRSIVDIFYDVEAAGNVRVTHFIAILITALFLFYFIANRYDIFQLKVNKIYVLFLLLSTLSVFLSQNLIYGFLYWLKLLQGFLFFNMAILLVLMSKGEMYKKRINAICWSTIIALLICYPLFLKNYIHGTSIVRAGYIRYAVFGSYFNLFSYYLLVVLPFCLFLYSITIKRSKQILWFVFMAVIFFTIYKTYTRNAWIGAAILLLIWNLVRKNFKLTFSVLAFILLIIIFNPIVQDRLKDIYVILKSGNFFSIDPKLLSARIGIWQSNLRYFISDSTLIEKLFGNGFDIKSEIMAFPISHPIDEHNAYLTLLMSTGICGLFTYLFYILILFKESFELLRRTKDVYLRNLAQVSISFLSAYVVTSFFTHMIWKINFQYYFSAFAGIVVAVNILERKKRESLDAS